MQNSLNAIFMTDYIFQVVHRSKEAWSAPPTEELSSPREAELTDSPMRVSHETIYRSLFVQARGVLKKELLRHLRTKRMMRKSKLARAEAQVRGRIAEALTIRERPAEADDRAVPGHWEGDLLCGADGSQIVTLVERQSRFTTLIKIPNREAETVATALSRHIRKLPTSLKQSLTWDRGLEMAFTVHFGDKCESLLLRSAEPMATRQQRKYQWVTAAVFPERHRSLAP
jgi:IS30 family transposase